MIFGDFKIKIVILSDGKYGDRAAKVIKEQFQETKLVTIEEMDPHIFLDEYNLDKIVEEEISRADLLISYVRHLDVVLEICDRQVPTILAVDFGEGFYRQIFDLNNKIVMPTAMCNPPKLKTGIKEIDEYFSKFGLPTFQVELDKTKNPPIIRKVELLRESPCSATRTSLELIRNKPLIPKTITEFGLNVRYECREPVSVLLSHKDMSDSSALLHMLCLLDALSEAESEYFLPGTEMGEYLRIRKEEYDLTLLDKVK